MNLYSKLYCGIYKLFKRGSDSIAEYSAIFVLAVIALMNTFAVLKLFGVKQSSFSSITSLKLFLAIAYLIVVFLNYLLFVKNDRYEKLLEIYEQLSPTEIDAFNYIVILLIIETIAIPFLV